MNTCRLHKILTNAVINLLYLVTIKLFSLCIMSGVHILPEYIPYENRCDMWILHQYLSINLLHVCRFII